MVDNTITWEQLWNQLQASERKQAMDAFWSHLNESPGLTPVKNLLLESLARCLSFRPQSVRKMTPERLKHQLVERRTQIFDHESWPLLFIAFYRSHRGPMMVAFLDNLSVPHDDEGLVKGDPEPPTADALVAAVEKLRRRFSDNDVDHYLAVLEHLGGRMWQSVGEARVRLQRAVSPEPSEARVPSEPSSTHQEPDARPDPNEPDDDRAVLDDFTTLDRLLINQVVASVSGVEGAMNSDQIDDLITTVITLNSDRKRSVFHLGFFESLASDREPEFNRAEFNDERRAWYLTGSLAAKVRQRDVEGFRQILSHCERNFQHAASRSEGAGPVMANLLLDFLFETRCDSEALMLLRGQLTSSAFRLLVKAYEHGTALWRDGDVAAALPVLKLLRTRVRDMQVEPGAREHFATLIGRRYGQCLQRSGNLQQAGAVFEGLLKRVEDGLRYELYADLGLLAGGFRSLERVRLPQGAKERASLRAALSRGQAWFEKALPGPDEHSANALYALAMRDYLDFTDPDRSNNGNAAREATLQHVQRALVGIRESRSFAVYERIGVFGQALFIEIVLDMDGLTVGESHSVLPRWERIPADSGTFPPEDLSRLLDCAELLNPAIATSIAKSIWRRHGSEAWDIFGGSAPELISRSSYLQQELLKEARDERNPRTRRFGLWRLLVPVYLETRDSERATEGLDAMEGIAEDEDLSREFLAWLSDAEHFDPVWTQAEVDWARVRLARRLGEDVECAALLNGLYFRLRDDDPDDAREVAQLLIDWQLDCERGRTLSAMLPEADDEPVVANLESRLANGARVSVLFIGGNETQARYDNRITSLLASEWPGVKVAFEHTGWSSNWGRNSDALVRAGSACDAVVIMKMMRTNLGRTLRAKVTSPWVPCTGTGREAMLSSIRKAVRVGLRQQPSDVS